MKQPSSWTSVHYKVLADSSNCLSLPELIGLPAGEGGVPATIREETQAALLDLIAAGAVDVYAGDARLTQEEALEVVCHDSSWTYEMWPDQVEVVENERTAEFARNRPPDKSPDVPLDRSD